MRTFAYLIRTRMHTHYECLIICKNVSFAWSDCGHTVHNESFGQVTSPNYPSKYSYYQNCSHIIWAPQRSHFHLNFLFFELQDCATCGGDWVEVRNSSENVKKREESEISSCEVYISDSVLAYSQ